MRNTFRKMLAIGLIGFQLTGCMTIMGRQSDDTNVYFDSNQEGTEINCSGKRVKTPGSIPLKKSKDHSCTAEAEGYDKQSFKIESGVSKGGFGASTLSNGAAWGWWTLGIGLVLGWAVDGVSGAMKNLEQENIRIELNPAGLTPESIPANSAAATPALMNHAPAGLVASPQMAFRISDENPNPPAEK